MCVCVFYSLDVLFLVMGMMVGVIDLLFSTTACLEIFSTDYVDGEFEMLMCGKVVLLMERFYRLVWGRGVVLEEMWLGLIVGGLVDGTVNVYNSAKIVDGV